MFKKPENILLVAATAGEIETLLAGTETNDIVTGEILHLAGIPGLQALITGPGMVATTFFLTRVLENQKYDLIINAGIAGGFRKETAIGQVVHVVCDSFPELGAEYENHFRMLYQMKMAKPYLPSFMNELTEISNESFPKLASILNLRQVKGVTVNTISNTEERIFDLMKRVNADVESMEGAAFFHCCHHYKIPCLQVRAISNHLIPAKFDTWNIPLAVFGLHHALMKIFDEIR